MPLPSYLSGGKRQSSASSHHTFPHVLMGGFRWMSLAHQKPRMPLLAVAVQDSLAAKSLLKEACRPSAL